MAAIYYMPTAHIPTHRDWEEPVRSVELYEIKSFKLCLNFDGRLTAAGEAKVSVVILPWKLSL